MFILWYSFIIWRYKRKSV